MRVNSTADLLNGELVSVRVVLIATLADFPGFKPFVHEFSIEYRVKVSDENLDVEDVEDVEENIEEE